MIPNEKAPESPGPEVLDQERPKSGLPAAVVAPAATFPAIPATSAAAIATTTSAAAAKAATTTAAAVATATSAAAAKAATTTATAALFTRLGFIHDQFPATHILPVHRLNGRVALGRVFHFDESEPA